MSSRNSETGRLAPETTREEAPKGEEEAGDEGEDAADQERREKQEIHKPLWEWR